MRVVADDIEIVVPAVAVLLSPTNSVVVGGIGGVVVIAATLHFV